MTRLTRRLFLGLIGACLSPFRAQWHPLVDVTTPGHISDETAARLKALWEASFDARPIGHVLVADGLEYRSVPISTVDMYAADVVETDETIATYFHVPDFGA